MKKLGLALAFTAIMTFDASIVAGARPTSVALGALSGPSSSALREALPSELRKGSLISI